MKTQQWQGAWNEHSIEVQVLPRLLVTEVRLLIDGQEQDKSVLFRTLGPHQLCSLAIPKAGLGLVEVSVAKGVIAVAVDGAPLTEQAPVTKAPAKGLAEKNALFCGLGIFVIAGLFLLVFNLIAQGFPFQTMPSPWPPLVLGLVMALYYYADGKKRISLRQSLKKSS
ncbi:hypothetical protein [Gallaecimonas mangrovi]|uniref:hypothetical protein n=1 Tax=Gallaecimonas mangrovi TaxID=2291597 RepID=UPI000E1FCD66|nr:hypothetical protein [Gallaecimonas mangrovi]